MLRHTLRSLARAVQPAAHTQTHAAAAAWSAWGPQVRPLSSPQHLSRSALLSPLRAWFFQPALALPALVVRACEPSPDASHVFPACAAPRVARVARGEAQEAGEP